MDDPSRIPIPKAPFWVNALIRAVLVLFYPTLILIGNSVPCPIKESTGMLCPSCGGTTMVRHLLEFQVEEAFFSNPFLLMTLPYLGMVAYWFIRYGTIRCEILLWMFLAGLLIFTIFRNI